MLTPSNFKCDRFCGRCCKETLAPLQKEDIARIKELGFSDSEFMFQDPFNKHRKLLKKQKNGWCIFLEKDSKNRYSCKIHANRPSTCKKYPFFGSVKEIESCYPDKLYSNVFFKERD